MELCIEWSQEAVDVNAENGIYFHSILNGLTNIQQGHLSSGGIYVNNVLYHLFKEEISHTQVLMKGSKEKIYVVGSRSATIHLVVLFLASLGRDWPDHVKQLFHVDMSPLDLCDIWKVTFPNSFMSFQ